jgi:hypothetical protein
MPLLWIQMNKIENHPRLPGFFYSFSSHFNPYVTLFLSENQAFFSHSSPLSGSFAARPTVLSLQVILSEKELTCWKFLLQKIFIIFIPEIQFYQN